jgi:aspartokinase-like uncharacterized kinase
MPTASGLTVIKVGGSLYDLPQLGKRLREFIDGLDGRVVVVPGGGPTADAIRSLDRWQALGEEIAHALALESLSVNASFLAHIIAGTVPVTESQEWSAIWEQGKTPIFDPRSFVLADRELPHSWAVTSDSIAARLAVVADARRLILLKSTNLPVGADWAEAGRQSLVDPFFEKVVSKNPRLQVQLVHFRLWQPSETRAN